MLKKLTPYQSLLIGFILIDLLGAFLLTLPIASSKGISQPFIDALFTATSALTTTGLTVVDTGSFYSLFGQIVILILIQIGGLGYMVFIAFIVYILGQKLSLGAGMTLKESIAGVSFENMREMAKFIILFTFLVELIGAFLLDFCWLQQFSPLRAFYLGIFHSVSAFNTAGFGLFSDSFVSYQKNILINIIISILCILGAIGFFVTYDLKNLLSKIIKNIRPKRLSIHSKFVLLLSMFIMIVGTAVIFISENWPSSLPFGNKLLISAFQAISAATTTGFNTIDIGAMMPTSLFIIILLMFIGASPGGTGGGIKTTTFGVIICFVSSLLKGKRNVNIFKKRISPDAINKAFAILAIVILVIVLDTLILTTTEKESFLQILFEIISAFGTVGLSTGITSHLSRIGELVITFTMLFGRIGPLAIGFSLVGRPKPERVKYTEGKIFVG